MVTQLQQVIVSTLTWLQADVAKWQPQLPVDVIYSNAALHWLHGHGALFRRLRSFLAPGGVLAVQVWPLPVAYKPIGVVLSDIEK